MMQCHGPAAVVVQSEGGVKSRPHRRLQPTACGSSILTGHPAWQSLAKGADSVSRVTAGRGAVDVTPERGSHVLSIIRTWRYRLLTCSSILPLFSFQCDLGQVTPAKDTMTASSGTILLTGANGGLGTAIVDAVVSKPELSGFHGIYTVRDANTATSLQSALQAKKPHSHETMSLDLSNLANVREVAAAVNAKVLTGEIPKIRALILNAAYRDHQGQTRTENGLDSAFACNYLGHWLLVLLLLQSMDQESGRIVVVSSWVYE